MNKIFLLITLFVWSACDNGDFELPSFTFNETVNSCGEYILYRTNPDKTEVLLLVLNTSVIKNEVTTTSRKLAISPSNTQYRIFDGAVGNDYFCQTIPPVEPIVLKKWDGVTGSNSYIEVITTEKKDNTTQEVIGYNHNITLKNMRLENGADSITYETYYFGVFTTSAE